MELTLAKSQGYLKSGSSSGGKRLLAVIGVYTGFGSHLRRNSFRGSWMPQGNYIDHHHHHHALIEWRNHLVMITDVFWSIQVML